MRETIGKGYHPINPSSAHSSSANSNADLSSLLKFREQTTIALEKALTTVRSIKSYSGKETVGQILTRGRLQAASLTTSASQGVGGMLRTGERVLSYPKKERNLKEKLISGPVIAAIILAGVGTGVGLTVHEHLTSENTPLVDSLTYPSVKEGTIKAEDIVRIPQEQIDALFPDAFGKINDEHNTIQIEYLLDISSSTKPNANIHFEKRYHAASWDITQTFKDQGYYNNFEFTGVPKGTTILSPVDGYVYVNISDSHPPKPNQGDNCNISIIFKDGNGNEYSIFLGGGGDGIANPFKNIINAHIYNPDEDRSRPIEEYGIFVKKGEPISRLVCNADIGFGLNRHQAQALESFVPENVEFFTFSDGKTILPADSL